MSRSSHDFVLQRKSIMYLMRTGLNSLNTVLSRRDHVIIYTLCLSPFSLLISLPLTFLCHSPSHTINLTHFYRICLILVSIFNSIFLHLSARVSDSEFTQVLMWLSHHFSISRSPQCSFPPPSPLRHHLSLVIHIFPFI